MKPKVDCLTLNGDERNVSVRHNVETAFPGGRQRNEDFVEWYTTVLQEQYTQLFASTTVNSSRSGWCVCGPYYASHATVRGEQFSILRGYFVNIAHPQ